MPTIQEEDKDLYKPDSPAHHRVNNPGDDDFSSIINKNFNSDEIARMEKSAAEGAAEDLEGTRPEELEKASLKNSQADGEDFYKEVQQGGPSKLRGGAFLSRNRGKVTASIAAIVILGGGGFGVFALLAGPLQFVQIAKMLQNFHFSNQEDVSDDRMTKISRYLRYNGDERTRLSILGNAYANNLESRMNRSGLTSEYNRGSLITTFDGYSIDTSNIPESSELSDLKNIEPDAAKAMLAEKYKVPLGNIDVDTSPGKILIKSEGLGYFESKRLIRTSLEEAGYSKIGSAIRSRIMGKRAGLDWHPIKRLDKKVLTSVEKRLAKWTEDREQRIQNGVEDTPSLSAGENVDSDGDGAPDSSSPDVQDAAAEAAKAGSVDVDGNPIPAGTPEPEVSAIKSKLGKAGAVSAVIGIICIAKSISENIDQIKQTNVVLPLMRLGGEGLAVGNQIITGQNVDPEQLGFLAKKLNTPEDGSWKSAKSIQAELRVDQTGPDINPEARISDEENVVSKVINSIPGVGTTCAVANSIIGQVVSTAIDFAGGPFSAVVGTVFGAVLGPKIIDGFSRWVAGHPISLVVAGANYGNYINYGSKLAARDSCVASGCRKLTKGESYELKQHQLKGQQEELQNKSFAARLLDPTDVKSLVGNFMSDQMPDPAQNIARVAALVPRAAASIFKLPSFLTPKAKAAPVDYDYGFDDYGYSVSELNNDLVKNPFENADAVATIMAGPKGTEYRERAATCFGMNIGTDEALTVKSTGQVPAYYKLDGKNCDDPSLEWLRIRFYIFDSQTMESYACYEDGANNTCGESGLDGSVNTPQPTTGSAGPITAPGLNGYMIPCAGLPTPVVRKTPGAPSANWSAIKDSGTIGTNSAGQPIKVYIRDACTADNVKTIVIVSSIHGSENGGQLISHELLFNAQLPSNVRIIAIPELNGSGISGSTRKNANGVDLNRNNDYLWTYLTAADETTPSAKFYRGTAAGSEPETAAVNTFLLALGKVSLSLHYHDNLNYVAPVGGTPVTIANAYASVTGMKVGNYDPVTKKGGTVVTQKGSLDAWYNSKTGTSAVLVEMGDDQSAAAINKHVEAVKAVLSGGLL